ncbi:TRIM3 [Branchiostoma lanceolatum]|uniref:TRIM3 protein n=1 Tax=Branchiostoma lanceolatum TaxID=7740 RepID=A0A8K0ECC0_BRALA|nr:TRIM3 [Branchiostoma lanceolatum]
MASNLQGSGDFSEGTSVAEFRDDAAEAGRDSLITREGIDWLWFKVKIQGKDTKTGQSLRCFPIEGATFGMGIGSKGQFVFTSHKPLFHPAFHAVPGTQAIREYSRDGKLTKTLKPACLGAHPAGVAVLRDGRMVVSDQDRNSCLLLQPDGSLIREIGKEHLTNPWFIAVDESRDLFFVTDYGAHKVCVFDLEGNLKFSFGKHGKNEGELLGPIGITLDPAGNIIVANMTNGRLQVFGPDGTYLRTVAVVKGACSQGITLTPDRHIAVASSSGILFYKY